MLATSKSLAVALVFVGLAMAPAALAQSGPTLPGRPGQFPGDDPPSEGPGLPGRPGQFPGSPGTPSEGPTLPGTPGQTPGTTSPLDVRVFLQGAFSGTAMRTDLRDGGLVPLAQPYGGAAFDGMPLAYAGAEVTSSMVLSNYAVVDWVLVELRAAPAAAPAARVAGLLLADGTVIGADGNALAMPGGLATGYVVVRHRSHAAAMTATTVDLTMTVDLTGVSSSYGSGGVVELAAGVWGLWAGDATGDGLVTAPDFNTYASASSAGAAGYELADFTLDGLVTAPDFNVYAASAAAGAASAVPEN